MGLNNREVTQVLEIFWQYESLKLQKFSIFLSGITLVY